MDKMSRFNECERHRSIIYNTRNNKFHNSNIVINNNKDGVNKYRGAIYKVSERKSNIQCTNNRAWVDNGILCSDAGINRRIWELYGTNINRGSRYSITKIE